MMIESPPRLEVTRVRMKGSFQHRKGFTLVEFLVVIAAIAFLIAILSPVIQMGITRAQAVRCVSNLKRFGAGIALYAADHNGRIPPTQDSSVLESGAVKSSAWPNTPSLWTVPYVLRSASGANSQELAKVQRCPSDKTVTDRWYYTGYTCVRAFMVKLVSGVPIGDGQFPRLAQAGNKVLMLDGMSQAEGSSLANIQWVPLVISNNDTTSTLQNIISSRHSGGANCLFGDGSVRWMLKSDLIENRHLFRKD